MGTPLDGQDDPTIVILSLSFASKGEAKNLKIIDNENRYAPDGST